MNNKEWVEGIRAITENCGGKFVAEFTRPEDIPRLLRAAMSDPAQAAHVSLSSGVATAITGKGHVVCLSCDTPVRDLEDLGAVLSLLPLQDAPTRGIGSAICGKCADRLKTADLWQTLVAEKLREVYGKVEIIDMPVRPEPKE